MAADFLRATLEHGAVPLPGPCDCGAADCPWLGDDDNVDDNPDAGVPMTAVVAGGAVPYLVKHFRLGAICHGGDRDALRTVQLYDHVLARVGRAMGEALRLSRMAVLPATQDALGAFGRAHSARPNHTTPPIPPSDNGRSEEAVRHARNVWDHAAGVVIKARSLPKGASLFRLLCHAVERPVTDRRSITLKAVRVALNRCAQDADEMIGTLRVPYAFHAR